MNTALTPQMRRLLNLIGGDLLHGKTLVVSGFPRSTVRALERRGLIRQYGAAFAATRAGLVEIGIKEPQTQPQEL